MVVIDKQLPKARICWDEWLEYSINLPKGTGKGNNTQSLKSIVLHLRSRGKCERTFAHLALPIVAGKPLLVLSQEVIAVLGINLRSGRGKYSQDKLHRKSIEKTTHDQNSSDRSTARFRKRIT